MARRILITGASVAGNTAAWTLANQGLDVVVVEQAAHFRDGGQNIDVRGVGRQVLQRMGLEQAALDHGTGEQGTAWVDEHGHAVATFKTDDIDGDGPTAELEILRGDLARLLYEAARDKVTYRFGDRIASIQDDGNGAIVNFHSGSSDRFDAVIIAEGVGSSTREQLFPGENDPRWMDLTIAYFTIARSADDDRLWRWYHTTGGRSISLRPDRHGTTRAMLSLQKVTDGEQDWDQATQKAYLREQFADAGWQAARVLDGMDSTDDFYFDALRQVRMPRWHTGRIVLTGDAAWCATPLAGIGATLAVTGGYVLASEIARTDDLQSAFAAYATAMRPMVEQGQGVPKIGPRLMNPHSRLGIQLLHGALKFASQPSIQTIAAKLMTPSIKAPDLARYD
ncbi:FAD-dependent monooxygenase [Xanthomonas hortorum]|uniref:FAD-binding monooxygenase n=1 Tax=Xanthomonas hortorum pv. pelargonii TaxID=453602 RepID=A0A6V7D0F5_9XANT|nr:FAD-dependent monooxygenase [Xanthomonas hortorum]MCE4353699.1 FAD-dependent monooxygenase [Xanthomonas hortorum pv. pelargonii]MCM5525072.1 FAD-dependent monooxygenase [Xanthomonas hortorum pv. pelargonii]MCM5537606.1 FAD-dependent monooxygenase [Xanthomonas hortorum pv. pelargonii]MCM5541773.1 FAD-dependent monooxygenase [Xanthomonas hortorum pv. pelargonii]MCM5545132.1 FAD-dependent monooxygenase [Xanthomonas hortorum pv. pelargonii]